MQLVGVSRGFSDHPQYPGPHFGGIVKGFPPKGESDGDRAGQRSLKEGTGEKEFLGAENERLEWIQGACVRRGFVACACEPGC